MSEKKFDLPPPQHAPALGAVEGADKGVVAGMEALMRRVGELDSHRPQIQAGVLAAFLLGLYNGRRFRFDLTELRRLDAALHDDCMAVLRMDASPRQEVHQYFENGSWAFEQMARDWGLVGDGSVSTGERMQSRGGVDGPS